MTKTDLGFIVLLPGILVAFTNIAFIVGALTGKVPWYVALGLTIVTTAAAIGISYIREQLD